MILLDLRWTLFGVLAAALGIFVAGAWLTGRRRFLPPTFAGAEMMRQVLESAPFGWLVLNGPRAYSYANLYARRLLELDSSSGDCPDLDWVSFLEQDQTAVRQESVSRYRTAALPSGQAVFWWVAPWNGAEIVYLQDVTAQQRAEQSSRHLLSDLSHELRTPLATILTHLEVLRIPNLAQDISQQSLYLLKEEARRMTRLVNDMLELGRLETGADIEHRPLDLPALVKKVVAQVAPQAQERDMQILLEAEAPLPLVVGDEHRLQRLFLNLLDNAIKHTRVGDRVVVSLKRAPKGIHCAVCDNGPGIPAEHLPHVTRRFYRVTPEGEGSGLGLALAAEILRRHRSRLELESRAEGPETGTWARFVLPVLEER